MDFVVFIPWLTFALLIGVLVLENKFGFRSPRTEGVVLRAAAPWWKKALVKWNDHFRYCGIFLFWIASNAFAVQARRAPGEETFLLLGVAGLGVVIYLVPVMWRTYVTRSDLAA
jgi:hypothetical protein